MMRDRPERGKVFGLRGLLWLLVGAGAITAELFGWPRRWLGVPLNLVVYVLLGGMLLRRWLRWRRAKAESARRGTQQGLFLLELDAWCDGVREPCVLTVDEEQIVFDPEGRTPDAFAFSLGDVTRIEPHASWIEIAARSATVRVVPRSFEERRSLLALLAQRCPAAFEPAAERVVQQDPFLRAGEGATAFVPTGPSSGLASELAGPMVPGNPAPPRNSGLGNGLFPPPPGN